MRTAGRKIISVLLILCTLFTFISCNRRFDKKEVVDAAKILLKDAEMLNLVYYGSGIKYYDSNESNGYYRKADTEHLNELGFSTIGELKTLTERTFSVEYSNLLYSTILSPLTSDTGMVVAARYTQTTDSETGELLPIMVYSKFLPMMKDTIEYDYDSIVALKSKKEKIYLSVDATVTTSDGRSQKTTVTITLVEEEYGWRIDNPTYANYNEYKDRYDELKDLDIKK